MLSGSISLARGLERDRIFSSLSLAHTEGTDSQTYSFPQQHVLLIVEKNKNQSLLDIWKNRKPTFSDVRLLFERWPLQAILIVAEFHHTGETSLRLQRNASATCPLYAYWKSGTLHLHWDGGQLYPLVPSLDQLETDICRAFLCGDNFYQEHTPFKNMTRLLDRATLDVTLEKGVLLRRPPSIAALRAKELVASADPVQALQGLLDAAIARWSLTAENTFCELSSGLDTTLIAHILAQRFYPYSLKTCGYLPLGSEAPLIDVRRKETVMRLKSMDTCPVISDYFDHAFTWTKHNPFWLYDAPTSFDKIQSAKRMREQGGLFVFSGIGGDELCELSEQERSQESVSRRFRRTQKERQSSESLLKDTKNVPSLVPWPTGLVPESVHDVAQSIAPLYLRQGLWYAHPLALPEIQIFSHFLPVEWRRGRKISRESLKRFGVSDSFLKQEPKESLSASLDSLLKDQSLYQRLFRQSVLLDLNIIDGDKLNNAYRVFVEGRAHPQICFLLLLAFVMESSLKSFLQASK